MFIEVVKATFKFQTYYKPPSYHELHTNLFKQSKVDVFKQVIKRIQNLNHKYGTIICIDGWDNIAWHPLLNVIIACLDGDVFIGSISTIMEWKHAHYICNAFAKYIETIGVNNIVQICRDNALSMKSVVNLLIHHFPNFYFQGCVHCLDLLLEDGGKTTWAKWIVKKKKFLNSHDSTMRP